MPRAAKASGIVIGFLGTGEMEVNAATDLVEEYINEAIKPDEPARFVFPLTSDEFSDSLSKLALMARQSKITYEVITNPDDKSRRAHTEVANAAAKAYHVPDVWTQMEAILVDAPQSTLMVLWDDKREAELNEIVGRFVDAGVKVMDLTDNLRVLSRDDDDAEGEAEAEADGEDEESDDEEQGEGDEDEDEEDTEDEASTVYTRAALEKMSHAAVKDIATGMGLAPRKARENMITAILEKQGGPQAVTGGSVESQKVTALPVEQEGFAVDLTGLREVLDDFGERFMVGLDEWLTKFSTAAEGFAFNTTPEEPMPVEEPEERPIRRLARNR